MIGFMTSCLDLERVHIFWANFNWKTLEFRVEEQRNARLRVRWPQKNLHFDASEADEAKNCMSLTNHAGRRPEQMPRRVFFAPPQRQSKWLDFSTAKAFLVTFWAQKVTKPSLSTDFAFTHFFSPMKSTWDLQRSKNVYPLQDWDKIIVCRLRTFLSEEIPKME